MQPIQQAFEPVSICFASDDNYAPYLKVAIYSLLCNRNRERSYDIIILHKRISKEHQGEILGLADGKSGVSIRFINVAEADSELQTLGIIMLLRRIIVCCFFRNCFKTTGGYCI